MNEITDMQQRWGRISLLPMWPDPNINYFGLQSRFKSRLQQIDMELSTQQIEHLFFVFGSNSPMEQKKAAEQQLVQQRQNSTNYPISILQLVSKPNLELQLRASIEFKLWSQNYAAIQQFEADKFASIMPNIKTTVLQLYLIVGDKPYKQLKEAITALCQREYFQNWKQLPPQLISVAGQNYGYLIRVLSLFKNITKRYAYELRSDPLYEEIIFSCNQMHNFLLATCDLLLNTIKVNQEEQVLKAMKQALKLFYNLNYQDLHPHFEDNLQKWMNILVQTLALQGQASNTQLFKCKGAALKSIILYSNKYQEDIYDQTIEMFSAEVWKLFTANDKTNQNFQNLLLDGLKFFRFLITWSAQKKSYSENIPDLMGILVLPNIGITQDVLDDFNEDTEKFIQCYFQNGDFSSRRCFAVDLLKSIIRVYPTEFSSFMIAYLQAQTSKQLTVQEECLMYNLIIDAGAAAYRSVEGCTHLSISQSIVTDCYTGLLKPKFQVIYEWIINNQGKQIQSNFQPLQIAFQLRYIYVFRIYIPKSDLPLLLKYASNLISNHETLRNIVYLTADAFLCIRHGDYLHYNNLEHYFKPQNIGDVAMDILKMIFLNEQKEQSLNKRLNALLQSVTNVFKQQIIPYSKYIINIISSLLSKTDTYEFKTILPIFEAFGNFLYWMVFQNQDISQIQTLLGGYLNKLMGIGSDLINFILQLYSIILLLKPTFPDTYHSIYQSLMKVQNWSDNNSSLFNSYVFYITSYLKKYPEKILAQKTSLQIILSKIIESKKPAIFFGMLSEIYNTCGLEVFSQAGYLKIIVIGTQTMVASMPDLKTSILKSALSLVCNIVNTNNPQTVVNYMNQAMNGFIQSLLLEAVPIVSTISWKDERKPMIIAIGSLLNTNCFTSLDNFGKVINALVKNTNRRARYGNSYTLQKNNLPIEGSFQRLGVFRQIKGSTSILKGFQMQNANEEKHLVQCINKIISENGLQRVGGVLTEQNQKQLSTLITKFKEQQQPLA